MILRDCRNKKKERLNLPLRREKLDLDAVVYQQFLVPEIPIASGDSPKRKKTKVLNALIMNWMVYTRYGY